ncbi:tetratricopeptide repeat protein [Lacibacter sp. H407]|uniref:tetratricopeptide repeat protein n=1 Tax=Lacibacter sp. H407 TaxID=3133423 RepID=UPI0030C400A3
MSKKFLILIFLAAGFFTATAQADKTDELYQEARKLRREGKCEAALTLFKQMIEKKPTMAAAHYELGWCYNELEQYDSALVALTNARKLDPTNFRIIYEAGFAKYKLGKVNEALADFNQVIKQNASYDKVYIARGDLYKDAQKKTALALADFLKALSLDSTESKIHYRIGWCYNDLGQFNEAVPYLQKAIGFEEQNYLSYSELGFSLFSMNRIDEALVRLNKANELKPGFETTVYYIGMCHVKQNKKADAVQKYNELVKLSSSYAASLLNEIKLMK